MFGYDDRASVEAQIAHSRQLRAKKNAGNVDTGKTIGTGIGDLAGLVGAIYTGQPQLIAAGMAAGGAAGSYIADDGSGSNDGAADAAGDLGKIALQRYAQQQGLDSGAGAMDAASIVGENYA